MSVRATEQDALRRHPRARRDPLACLYRAVVETEPFDGDQQRGLASILEGDTDRSQRVIHSVRGFIATGISGQKDSDGGRHI